MTTHCRFCGEAVRPNTMFCPACGQIIGGDAPRPQSAPPFATTGGRRQDESPQAPAKAPASLPPVPLPDAPAWARPAPIASAPVAPAPAAPAPAPAAPAPEPAGPKRSAPRPTPGAERSAPAAVPVRALVLPGGARIAVDRMLVLGRQPAAGAAQRGGVAVEVADPARSMSRVHLVVEPSDRGGARATDPGSGNGTVVERVGSRHPLVKDTPFELAAGDRLVLGDVVVTVA